MPINFDNFIKDRIVYYDPTYRMDDIIAKLVNGEWDIIAYRDNIIAKKNKNIPMIYRDVITNIKADDAQLYYIIDGVSYPIRDDTRIISALTPFKTIYLRVFSEKNNIRVTFTRLLIKDNLINDLRKEIVFDANFTYHGGELI